MEILILLTVASLVITIILGGVYLTCRRVNNYCTLSAMHENLVARIAKTRMGKMLGSLNISLHNYVRAFPAAAIDSHMRTCSNCDSWRACDFYLAGDEQGAGSARVFCPNMKEFDALRDAAEK